MGLKKFKFFFEENLETLKNEYEEVFEEEWNVSSIENIKKIYNLEDNFIGYLVDFDLGYLAYGLDYEVYQMDIASNPSFFNQDKKLYYASDVFMEKINDNFYLEDGSLYDANQIIGNSMVKSDIYYQIETRLNYKGFKINSSCTKIPKLKNMYDSSNWGDYQAVSFVQKDTSDCGVIAIMNLLHTFRLSGSTNYTKDIFPVYMKEELRELTNWQGNIAGEGLLPADLIRGCTNYINLPNIALKARMDYNESIPGICLYCNLNVGGTSHYAMKVGTAQQDYWWIFKTYWDIIISWEENYETDNRALPISIKDNTTKGYHLVDKQYRQGMFQLYNGTTLIK